MNSPSAHRVRFACRVARHRAALADQPGSSHVASCPACQQYLAASVELDQQLTLQARRRTDAVPAGLDERIYQAIQPTLRQARRRRAPKTWFAVGLAGTAAAIALLVGQWRPAAPASAPPLASAGQPVTAEGTALVVTAPPVLVDQWSDRLWSALGADAPETGAENPLQREIAAVRADTQSALRFLARNFLPESTGAEEELVRSSS